MLTSVFYYNLYKPYIISNANSRGNGGYSPRRDRIANRRDTPETSGSVFVLNKSVKNEMVNYARAVSHGVTDLRTGAARIASNMQDFNRTAYMEGRDSAMQELTEQLTDFAQNYNIAANFMQEQEHSDGLRAFSYEMADNISQNQDRLQMLGLNISEQGQIFFDAERVSALSFDEINAAIGETIEIFEGLHAFAQQLLTEPLVNHMRFSGLNYHYNYRRGKMETDGFALLEMGLLLDKVV